ncbi:Rhodanese- sulfurtransferase [Coemansia nantahalensis]|uniref:Rhodanese- sulfurtransferase n=2 Tax=Coemansia TaxID=4863 RepID=A0ACC1LDW3_9FUNG|nr:Rhodanese- sulfurtransferase [Coemansia nantahalensis]KAJ2769431.1 Rhodanese- sulfurtransferase [Coemansia nantahalensis]KAJ2805624.1 Rhodanese- sulfurtransferase [Coemansia helicoidea]
MDVSGILEEHKSRLRPVQVDRLIPVDHDLGSLAGFDINMLNDAALQTDTDAREAYLQSLSREGTQLLVNELFSLPTVVDDDSVYAALPKRTTVLPREKPVPKEKEMTRWEKFAKIKGIQKRKRGAMVFDEAQGEWRPRFGFKGVNNDGQQPWLLEVPQNADQYQDQYQVRREEKKERIAKNMRRQQRNTEESAAKDVGLSPYKMRKRDLQSALVLSKGSTASMGRFDAEIKGEPRVKGLRKKRSPLVGAAGAEKSKSMDILNRVAKGDTSSTVLNVRKAQRAINNSKRAAGSSGGRDGGNKRKGSGKR